MDYKPLIINNNDSIKALKKYKRCKQCSIAMLYFSLFVPVVLNFVYLFVIGLKLDHFVDNINQTKLLHYLSKTETIINFICENENICLTENQFFLNLFFSNLFLP